MYLCYCKKFLHISRLSMISLLLRAPGIVEKILLVTNYVHFNETCFAIKKSCTQISVNKQFIYFSDCLNVIFCRFAILNSSFYFHWSHNIFSRWFIYDFRCLSVDLLIKRYIYLKIKMIDYKLVEKYKSYNIFIGDIIESSDIEKDDEGRK